MTGSRDSIYAGVASLVAGTMRRDDRARALIIGPSGLICVNPNLDCTEASKQRKAPRRQIELNTGATGLMRQKLSCPRTRQGFGNFEEFNLQQGRTFDQRMRAERVRSLHKVFRAGSSRKPTLAAVALAAAKKASTGEVVSAEEKV